MKPSFQIAACCESDTGLVRSYNEDTCLVNNEDRYFLVADGMGGAAAGEKASSLFKETVVELFSSTPKRHLTRESLDELIIECFHAAHTRILTHVKEVPSHQGMGCTAELLVFQEREVIIGHVGDSRTYRWRGNTLEQLTSDHSFVQEQEDLGLITHEQARNHALKNLLIRVVGSSEKLEVDLISSDARPGDIFLLCTDGLFGMVEDQQIAEILSYEMEPAVKATMLIDQANYGGGKDNISVALIEISAP
jgi:protein phosphatase